MQFVHYAVFGVAYLRAMNFVTQPSVELYKTIAGEIYADAKRAGSVSRTPAWCSLTGSLRQSSWRRRVTMYYDTVDAEAGSGDAAARYASLVRQLQTDRSVEYGELTFFGDLRLGPAGRAMRTVLERAADRVFRPRAADASRRLRGSSDEPLVSRDDHRPRPLFFDRIALSKAGIDPIPQLHIGVSRVAIPGHEDGAGPTRSTGRRHRHQ
jgi:hypothetical protein